MKREEKREQTLQLLLDTTRRLVQEKGCVKTTFGDIMERSGLSKGAIFHYVKGKDDLLGMVLQAEMEETDRQFFETIDSGRRDFQGPMNVIASGLPGMADPRDPTSLIFRYLLGRAEEPGVSDILGRYYGRTVEKSAEWIQAGQTYGVIPAAINAKKTAELFVLVTLGLRMRGGIPADPGALTADDVGDFIRKTLQPDSDSQEGG